MYVETKPEEPDLGRQLQRKGSDKSRNTGLESGKMHSRRRSMSFRTIPADDVNLVLPKPIAPRKHVSLSGDKSSVPFSTAGSNHGLSSRSAVSPVMNFQGETRRLSIGQRNSAAHMPRARQHRSFTLMASENGDFVPSSLQRAGPGMGQDGDETDTCEFIPDALTRQDAKSFRRMTRNSDGSLVSPVYHEPKNRREGLDTVELPPRSPSKRISAAETSLDRLRIAVFNSPQPLEAPKRVISRTRLSTRQTGMEPPRGILKLLEPPLSSPQRKSGGNIAEQAKSFGLDLSPSKTISSSPTTASPMTMRSPQVSRGILRLPEAPFLSPQRKSRGSITERAKLYGVDLSSPKKRTNSSTSALPEMMDNHSPLRRINSTHPTTRMERCRSEGGPLADFAFKEVSPLRRVKPVHPKVAEQTEQIPASRPRPLSDSGERDIISHVRRMNSIELLTRQNSIEPPSLENATTAPAKTNEATSMLRHSKSLHEWRRFRNPLCRAERRALGLGPTASTEKLSMSAPSSQGFDFQPPDKRSNLKHVLKGTLHSVGMWRRKSKQESLPDPTRNIKRDSAMPRAMSLTSILIDQ
jgi:hypothetical protein